MCAPATLEHPILSHNQLVLIKWRTISEKPDASPIHRSVPMHITYPSLQASSGLLFGCSFLYGRLRSKSHDTCPAVCHVKENGQSAVSVDLSMNCKTVWRRVKRAREKE
jgi:hypothetical protein